MASSDQGSPGGLYGPGLLEIGTSVMVTLRWHGPMRSSQDHGAPASQQLRQGRWLISVLASWHVCDPSADGAGAVVDASDAYCTVSRWLQQISRCHLHGWVMDCTDPSSTSALGADGCLGSQGATRTRGCRHPTHGGRRTLPARARASARAIRRGLQGRLDRRDHFLFRREAALGGLSCDLRALYRHHEDASAALDELSLHARCFLDCGRRPDGPRQVASSAAVFDRDRHPNLLGADVSPMPGRSRRAWRIAPAGSPRGGFFQGEP